MSPVIITLVVLLGVVLLLAIWLMSVYNGLVVARKRFQNAFAQIDVQLKPVRLDPEPGRSRQGLHGPRAGDARCRHQSPQQCAIGRAESRREPQRRGGHQGA